MFTLLYHLKNRYMSQRAQGIVEYAIVIAFVIVIGWALLGSGNSTIADTIQTIWNKIWELLNTAGTKSAAPSTGTAGGGGGA